MQPYSFIDPYIFEGKAFYRLKMIANGNSTFKYSSILSISLNRLKEFKLTNLVNPFASKLTFQVIAPQYEKITVELLDVIGRFIQEMKITVQKGTNLITMELVTPLQIGTYLLRMKSNTGYLKKMIQHLL